MLSADDINDTPVIIFFMMVGDGDHGKIVAHCSLAYIAFLE